MSSGPRPTAHPVPAPPRSNPHQFGRVDDDGTVWLITAAGERIVGSWQAGDREAAFAHFGRRFDDLATEVTLMEERLAAGTGDARKIKAHASELADTLATATVLGDIDALARRLTSLIDHVGATVAEERSRRDEHRATQTARKEALAAEAEELGTNSTQWKAAGDRLRAILDEWKTINGLDRKVDDALWKRYSAARETFNRRRGSHFAELDRERLGVRQAKERLCERAEELSDSTDWTATSAEFRKLLTEWKAAGRAARDVDDALWRRFKAAQDVFFTARNAATAEKDAELRANATAKEALLAEAEKIDTSNQDAARAALRSIAEKWDAIGKVPRERSAELERRLRAVEKKVRDAGEADWSDPQAQARAEQFRIRAEQYEQQAEKAAAAGRTKEAEEATANAEQWRQWAQAAAEALTRKS
ncbi:DNA repair ATPase [Mycobacterium nebraskense]|nr:DNA repair ATPase [Mycobacterium nebraskense]